MKSGIESRAACIAESVVSVCAVVMSLYSALGPWLRRMSVVARCESHAAIGSALGSQIPTAEAVFYRAQCVDFYA